MPLKQKTLLFSSMIFLIFAIIVGIIIYDLKINQFNESTANFKKDITSLFNSQLKQTEKDYRYRIQGNMNSVETVKAFAEGDRNELIKQLSGRWDIMQIENPGLNVMQLHRGDGTSLLRMHKQYSFDDKISKLRPMVEEIHKTKKPLSGYESGIYALSYRVFEPIFYKEKYIGAVEFGIDPNIFAKQIHDILHIESYLFINKDNLNFENNVSSFHINNYIMHFSTANQIDFLKTAKDSGYNFQKSFSLTHNGKRLIFHSFDMKNYKGDSSVKYVFIQDVTTDYNAVISALFKIYLALALMFLSCILVINFGFDYFIKSLENKNIELEFARQELDAIFRNNRDGIALFGDNTVFLDFNPAYEKLTGYSREELLSKSCLGLTHPDDITASKEAIKKVMTDGFVENLEKRCLRKDGTAVYVQISMSLLPDEKTVIAATKDISHIMEYQNKLKASENRFRGMIEKSPVPIMLFNKERECLFVNPKFTNILGYTIEDIKNGREWWEKTCPTAEYRNIMFNAWERNFESKSSMNTSFVSKVFTKYSKELYIQYNFSDLEDLKLVVLNDITKLVETEYNLQNYVDIVDKYVITSKTDLQGYITYASASFCKISGYTKEELIGKNHNISRHPDMKKESFQDMWATIKEGKCWTGEVKNRTKDGGFYWVDTVVSPVFNLNGEICEYMAVRQDITDKKRIEELSVTDRLTGVFNRVKLDDVLENETVRFKRYGASFCVIIFDIDLFKNVNDKFGHLAGDNVLRHVACNTKKNIRETDILGRWGGEEFLIICPNTNIKGAVATAEKVRKFMESYNYPDVGKVTASFGISEFTDDDDDKENIVRRADEALYKAKANGRNRVEIG